MHFIYSNSWILGYGNRAIDFEFIYLLRAVLTTTTSFTTTTTITKNRLESERLGLELNAINLW